MMAVRNGPYESYDGTMMAVRCQLHSSMFLFCDVFEYYKVNDGADDNGDETQT